MDMRTVSKWLVVLGAIQLGLSQAVNFDLVTTVLGNWPGVIQVLYVLIGVAGLWGAYGLATKGKK